MEDGCGTARLGEGVETDKVGSDKSASKYMLHVIEYMAEPHLQAVHTRFVRPTI